SIEEENGVEEGNVVQREEEDVEDISQVQDVVLQGDIRFLEELLIDNSILSHESSDFNFEDNPNESSDFEDNSLFPRPPSKPPDVEFCFDLEPNLISTVMDNIDKLNEDECFDPGEEID
nr:hypothetical protein [Tanacetum cinerariifolium]